MMASPNAAIIRSAVEGKNVILIGNSPTVSFLVKNREFFRDKDFVYGGLNHWVPIERDFLCPIDREFRLLFVSAPPAWQRHLKSIRKFSHRNSSVLITDYTTKYRTPANLIDMEKRFNLSHVIKIHSVEYDSISSFSMSDWGFPSLHTILLFIAIVMLGKPRSILVFGCDGVTTKDFEQSDLGLCHYSCTKRCTHPAITSEEGSKDTVDMINSEQPVFQSLMDHMREVSGVSLPPIYLVGHHSKYHFGEKVGKDRVLSFIEERLFEHEDFS